MKRHFFVKLGVIAALMLTGCASTGVVSAGTQAHRELLQPWIDLTGANSGALGGLPSAAQRGGAGYVTLRHPTAVSARGNDVYLVDAGLRRIFRYGRAEQTLAPFTSLAADAGMSIYAAPDLSVYITDPARGQVLHFAWDGAPLPPLSSPGNLGRPIAVTWDEGSGQLLVADGLYDQIVAFNNLGRPLSVIKPQRVRAIAAMAQGPDGIYVVDRLARQVVVLGPDGAYRYAFGAGTLADPKAIAVDRGNLVFVGDNFDQTVKVYRGGQLVATAGGAGAAPGRFNGIAGLAVDGGLLYAADSLNARVQIMLITPQALDTKGE
ncbi:MAG: NHL repeat-containing protein [Sulfuricella sp.]